MSYFNRKNLISLLMGVSLFSNILADTFCEDYELLSCNCTQAQGSSKCTCQNGQFGGEDYYIDAEVTCTYTLFCVNGDTYISNSNPASGSYIDHSGQVSCDTPTRTSYNGKSTYAIRCSSNSSPGAIQPQVVCYFMSGKKSQ